LAFSNDPTGFIFSVQFKVFSKKPNRFKQVFFLGNTHSLNFNGDDKSLLKTSRHKIKKGIILYFPTSLEKILWPSKINSCIVFIQ